MPSEFFVNDIVAGSQRQPDILAFPDGSFLIVWESYFDVDLGSGYFIGGQRYAADGTRIGGNIIFDARAGSDFRYVDVTLLDDGGFVLAYEDGAFSDNDPNTIFLRVFNSDFTERTTGRVQTTPTDQTVAQTPEVVALEGGGFMLLSTVRSDNLDGFATEIYARLYDENGIPEGNGFQLNTNVNDQEQFNPFAAQLTNGNIIVIWDSDNTGPNPVGFFSLDETRASLLSPDGDVLRSDFVLVPSTGAVVAPHNTDLSVTALNNGGFAITYFSSVDIDGDPVGSIAWRLFDENGNATSPEFTAFAQAGIVPDNGNIVELSGGEFLVVWDNPGDNDSFADALGQVFSRTGVPLSDVLEFTNNDANNQEFPRIAALPNGGFVVTYETDTFDFNDPDIAARIYDSSVYTDDPVTRGTNNGERIVGTAASDTIFGLGGDDVLIGRAGADELRGGTGEDRLEGGSGGDQLFGGSGIDTASYLTASSGVSLNLTAGIGYRGHANGDSFVSIENVVGSDFGDVLIGSAGDNFINGGRRADELRGSAGEDILEGGGGADIINGGSGVDTASFTTAGGGVGLNLTRGVGFSGNANGDTYIRIENILGSDFSDVLIGSAGDNLITGGRGADELRGSAGDDILEGGAGGDFINGGSGVDTASFTTAGSGVTLNLTTGVGTRGNASGDTYVRIENVLGSAHSDVIIGSSGDNVLQGWLGNDELRGSAGDDTLNGGRGDDILRGGSGDDLFIFRAGNGDDVIEDFSRARDTITFRINGLDFADLEITTVAGNAIIDYGSGTIELEGLSANLVTEDMFSFG